MSARTADSGAAAITTAVRAERREAWQPGSWANLPPKLAAAAERLRGVCLEHGDALDLIPRWDLSDTVIYVDPPYIGEHRLTMSKGYRHDATPDLWARLVEVLESVERTGVILSGVPGPRGRAARLAHGHAAGEPERAGARRRHAPRVPETVWLSPSLPEQVPSLLDEAVA